MPEIRHHQRRMIDGAVIVTNEVRQPGEAAWQPARIVRPEAMGSTHASSLAWANGMPFAASRCERHTSLFVLASGVGPHNRAGQLPGDARD